MRQWSIGRRLSLVTLMVLALLGLLLFFCLQIYQQGLMGEKSRQTQAQGRDNRIPGAGDVKNPARHSGYVPDFASGWLGHMSFE